MDLLFATGLPSAQFPPLEHRVLLTDDKSDVSSENIERIRQYLL